MRLFRIPILTVVLALSAVAFSATPSPGTALQFDRAAVVHGEVWRIVTCHLTHWTRDHLAWDVLTFALLGAMAESAAPRRFAACLLTSFIAIPVTVAWAQPDLATYRGLSGIDSALFGLVLAEGFRRGGASRIVAIVAGIALASKVGFEIVTGQALFVDASAAGFMPVPAAHAMGAVAGLLVGLIRGKSARPVVNVWGGSLASRVNRIQSGPAHYITMNASTRLSS